MYTFLLKTTLIWLVLLLFYFAFLNNEKALSKNRLFLWLGLILGIIIPLLQNPFSYSSISQTTEMATLNLGAYLKPTGAAIAVKSPVEKGFPWRLDTILSIVWLTGAAVQVFLLIKSGFQLYHLKKHSERKRHSVAEYFIHPKTPTAFSFGKAIFLPIEDYSDKDLAMILEHEAAHFHYRHWLDNVLLALLQVVFWFHPLFYLFRSQIKLVHEFQVDKIVSVGKPFDYGNLLLRQNQLPLKKVLVHTFNYSPLKKRIAMLTKNQKSNAWKYALSLPLFALCFVMMSAKKQNDNQRVRKGNITMFNGNKIVWANVTDTFQVVHLHNASDSERLIKTREIIKECNNLPVTEALDYKSNKMQSPFLDSIYYNISVALEKLKDQLPKSIAWLQVQNLVIDRNGKVYYYDVQSFEKSNSDSSYFKQIPPNSVPKINKLVDQILANPKVVNPKNYVLNKPFYSMLVQANYGSITLKVKLD